MIGGLLSKIGGALMAPVGGIHDALWSDKDTANPAKYSQIKEYSNDTELTWTGENLANTVKYYVGGTLVVTALAAFAIGKMKKPKVRYIRRKARTRRK